MAFSLRIKEFDLLDSLLKVNFLQINL